jgi:hypothetical protein
MGDRLQALYSPILMVEFATMTFVYCFSAFVFVAVSSAQIVLSRDTHMSLQKTVMSKKNQFNCYSNTD